MEFMSNLLCVLIERQFHRRPKCYDGYKLLRDNKVLLLLLLWFILIEQMGKDVGGTN